MTAATRVRVRERAAHRCEYCQTHQDDSPLAAHHIEHIRPIKHGGTDEYSENPAFNGFGVEPHLGLAKPLLLPAPPG